MNVHFDPGFDGGAWPGPLASRTASAGEAWVGNLGLLSILESQLGLSAPPLPASLRAAGLLAAVRAQDGFWSASAGLDPLGVARRLLAWRDALRLCGWRGEPVTERARQLARVTDGAAPGVPDRIEAIAAALARRSVDLRVTVPFDLAELEPAWRDLLLRLGAVRVPLPDGPASGDLAASRAPGFTPAGDGSLQLVRPHGALAAAEAVAAWLASAGDLDGCVIVAPDPLLDDALHRHGLPVTGSSGTGADNALLQLLPLVIAAGWDPPDPRRVLELLSLPVSPVPAALRTSLIRALQDEPAVGSSRWRAVLEEKLPELEEPRQKRVRELLEPTVSGATYPLAELARRTNVLRRWLAGRADHEPDPAIDAALAQCAALDRVSTASGLQELPRPLVQLLLEEAAAAAPAPAPRVAEAGLAAVADAAAIAGPARRVILWNATRAATTVPPPPPLGPADRAALAAAGFALPDPGAQAIAAARRWRRPLLQATQALIVVCPERAEDGSAAFPPPLWDEVVGHLARGASAAALEVRVPLGAPAGTRRRPLALPAWTPSWRAPVAVPTRELESPTSVEKLLGCSLVWALEYAGKVRPGVTAELPDHDRLVGSTVHAILAEVFETRPGSPAEARDRAEARFDESGPRRAAPLFLPGADAQRADARRIAGEAAHELARILAEGNLKVVSVETPYRRPALGAELAGTPDLVVEDREGRRIPVDLKHAGKAYRRRSLKAGTAAQLAAYGFLTEHMQPGAFFILSRQELVTTNRAAFPGAVHVDGPDPAETWSAIEAAHARRRRELGEGELAAPGDPGVEREPESALVEGELRAAPPCRFCDHGAICGRTFGREP